MNELIPLAIVTVIWSGFVLWTIKKLWRSSGDLEEALFWARIKVGSLTATIGFALVAPMIRDLTPMSYWLQVVLWVLLLFPAAMWAWYIGTRCLDAFFDGD